jgi:hypothetical protein
MLTRDEIKVIYALAGPDAIIVSHCRGGSPHGTGKPSR